jgi:hypothetical protein
VEEALALLVAAGKGDGLGRWEIDFLQSLALEG